jgi:hypothetical protein
VALPQIKKRFPEPMGTPRPRTYRPIFTIKREKNDKPVRCTLNIPNIQPFIRVGNRVFCVCRPGRYTRPSLPSGPALAHYDTQHSIVHGFERYLHRAAHFPRQKCGLVPFLHVHARAEGGRNTPGSNFSDKDKEKGLGILDVFLLNLVKVEIKIKV